MEPRSARSTRRRTGEPAASREATVDKLRRLIVGPEQGRIERLEERPAVTADAIGELLPEAVAASTSRRREQLAIALEPTVTTAIRTVAGREAEFFGEILSPSIGAAVRKAVSDAIEALTQRFNAALERSLSVSSVRWRIEARRTGRPFAEVVLLHTVVYRVEEVFLIHPNTGLVLERAAAKGAGVLEPDQVAAMLEAIDRFVREAFAPLPGGVHVGRIAFGDFHLWVERSPQVALAALVRGVAPESFAGLLRDSRERIALERREELTHFESNVAPFAAARPWLERCLESQRRPAPNRARIWFPLAAGAALLALGAFAVLRHERAAARQHTVDASVAALASEPGLVVTTADWADHRARIRGLRDPLASAPERVLAARGLPPASVDLAPFSSLDPAIVEQRARDKLAAPQTVWLEQVGGVLHAHGVAPQRWLEDARRLAPAVAGVERYDESDLRSQESVGALAKAADVLERVEVAFALGSSDLRTAVGLPAARLRARQLVAAASDARVDVCLSVVGHTDPSGGSAQNRALSEARARGVADDLVAHGVGQELVRPVGAGVGKARSVTFHVSVGCGAP